MKIEVITKYFYPVAAGIETNILETYSILAKKGHKVTIHTSKDNYLEKNAFPAKETFRGLEIRRYPFKSEISGYMPDIDWDNTDVVCLHNFNVSHFRILTKILLRKITGKKKFGVIITPHGGFNPEWKVFDWPTRIKKFLYQYTVGTIFANLSGDGFRAVSDWEAREMIKKGISGKKIEVITNGLEDEAYADVDKKAGAKIKKQVKEYGDYIIQVGRVYPIKNYETTIRTLPLIDRKINYVIVGQTQDTAYLQKLKDLAKELGVEDRLFFAGVIRGIDKYYIIKKAKIMVHMAIWESFCNVVHEGLSQGLVCIVADNTALPFLVKDGINGFTVETKNHIKLAEKINYVIKNFNSPALKKMRETNKKIGEKESWSFVAGKMEFFYKNVIEKIIKKSTPTGSKFKSVLGNILLLLFMSTSLVLAMRGNMGNPDVITLRDLSWRDHGPFELSPERGRFALVYSVVEYNSVYFPVDLARFVIPDLGYINGNYVSLFAPAVSYLTIPGYLIGKYFGAAQIGTFSIIALFGIMNVFLIKAISKKLGATDLPATLAGIIYLFATPAFTYSVSLYQHQISTFLILSALYLLIAKNSVWSLSAIWFLCAASIPVDYPNLIIMFPIGLAALGKLFEINKLKDRFNISVDVFRVLSVVSVIIPLGFFLWFNNASYGNPFQLSGTVDSAREIDVNGLPTAPKNFDPSVTRDFTVNADDSNKSAVGFFKPRAMLNGIYIHLFSPDRGLIYFAPVLLFAILGAFSLYKKESKLLPVLVAIIGANLFLYSMWGDPWGGWAFGSRYLIPSYAILSIILALALQNYYRNLFVIIPMIIVLIYSIMVNTLGAITTSTIPPKDEAKSLEKLSNKHERYSIDRNWQFLNEGKSKSVFYWSKASGVLSTTQYFYYLSGFISLIAVSLMVANSLKPKKENV